MFAVAVGAVVTALPLPAGVLVPVVFAFCHSPRQNCSSVTSSLIMLGERTCSNGGMEGNGMSALDSML